MLAHRHLLPRLLGAAAACLASGGAQAVGTVCTAGSQSVLFGNYNPSSATPLSINGSVTVSCTALLALSVPYTVLLSAGSGSVSARHLAGAGSTLNYNLYTSGSYGTVWDNTTGVTGTVSVLGVLGLFSGSDTKTVFGRIPARQFVAPGLYTDSIVITVNY